MAFIVGTDTRDVNSIGNGAPVGIMEQQLFYTKDTTLANYNPYAQASTYVRIKGAELKSSEKTNTTPYYDQFNEIGVKQGRVESTFEITQDYYGLAESIKTLKNQELWFVEGLQDDRMLIDANSKPIFQELNFYKAKMVDMTEDKGDTFKVTGSGKYNTSTKFTVMKGITPVSPTLAGNATATTGTPYTATVTANDLYGASIDLTDLSDVDLAGEITAINIVKVSGTPTMSVAAGASNNIKQVTFTGTGSVVIKAQLVTKNGGTFETATKSITVS